MEEFEAEIIDSIKSLRVCCPECAYIEDDQYQCETCGCQGGNGSINVVKYVKSNYKEFLK